MTPAQIAALNDANKSTLAQLAEAGWKPTGSQPASREERDNGHVDQIANTANQMAKKVQATVASYQQKIDSLDKDLNPEVWNSRAIELKNEGNAEIREAGRVLTEILSQAESLLDRVTVATTLRQARFAADDPTHAALSSSWALRLQKSGPADLLALAQDAVGDGDYALAELIRIETSSRGNALPASLCDQIAELVDSLPLPLEAQRRRDRLATLAVDVQAALVMRKEFVQGRRAAINDKIKLGLRQQRAAAAQES